MPTTFGFLNSKGELIPLSDISKACEAFDDWEYDNAAIAPKYKRSEICPLYNVLQWMALSDKSIADTIALHPQNAQSRLCLIFKWLHDQVDLVSFNPSVTFR